MKKIILTGILKEKNFGTTQSGNAYARIAVSEIAYKKDGTPFETKTTVTVWNQTLVNVLANIMENSTVLIEGDVGVRMYDKQDGSKGAVLDVTANSLSVLEAPQVPEIVNVYGTQPTYQQPMQQPMQQQMQQPVYQQPMYQQQPVEVPTENVNTVEIPVGYTPNTNNFNGM